MAKTKKGFLDGYKTYDTSNGHGSVKEWQSAFESRMNYKVLTIKECEENKSIIDILYDCKDAKELQKTYHKLMMKYHPDICGDTEENKIISQLINDTYFKLKK
jgi:hypothetical protein